MEYEVPATGISKVSESKSHSTFNVQCDCSDPEHSIMLDIEREDVFTTLSIYVTTELPFWQRNFNRLKIAFQVLFTGRFKAERCLILQEQQAINLAHAILNGINKVA